METKAWKATVLRIDRSLKGVESAFFHLGAALILAISLLVVYSVFARSLGWPSSWVLQVSEYLMVAITFFVAPWILRLGRHISMDLLEHVLARPGWRLFNVLRFLLTFIVLGFFFWASVDYVADLVRRGAVVREAFNISQWLVYTPIVVGGLLLTLECLLSWILRRDIAGVEENEASGMAV